MLFKKLPTKVIKRGRRRKIKTEALDIEKSSAKSSPESVKCRRDIEKCYHDFDKATGCKK